MRVFINAFAIRRVSPNAEAKIGRIMKQMAVKEGHKPRLPGRRLPWNAST